MDDFVSIRRSGLPLGKLNYLMAAFTVIISVLLLFATFRTKEGYQQLRSSTEDYIQWQHSAYDLQLASDYLTDQVRCFTVTGEMQYLENYFREAKVTRRRENALSSLETRLRDSSAYQKLSSAMVQSLQLMEREYYAMRLTAEANNYDLSQLPEEIQDVQLSALDATLSPGAKEELAQRMVFDSVYQEKKSGISQSMQDCMDALVTEIHTQQTQSSNALSRLLINEQTLIIIFIAIVMAIVLLTSLLVISPLLRAVLQIREEQPIPVHGSYEFRFLAKTYNLMYEVHRASREQLAFEASHDKLTGVYNRTGFDHLLKNINLANCALVLLDVDDFKTINDTYGHDMGDRVLQRVTTVVGRCFRAQDFLCRMGGDEFAVLVNAMNVSQTTLLRQKIDNINHSLNCWQDGMPPVSISVGICFGEQDIDRKTLLDQADTALYQVKASGKCGCAFFHH